MCPSSHIHGSGEWVPPISISFHLGWFFHFHDFGKKGSSFIIICCIVLPLHLIIPNKTAWTTRPHPVLQTSEKQVCRKRKWSQILKMTHPAQPSGWVWRSIGWFVLEVESRLSLNPVCQMFSTKPWLTESVGPMLCLVADPLLLSYRSSWKA